MKLPHNISTPVPAAKCCLLLALLVAPLAALASSPSPSPSDAEVERLLVAARTQSQIQDLLLQYINAFQEPQLAQLAISHEVNDAEIARFQRIDQRRNEAVQQAISWSRLRPMYVDLCKRTYSRDDVIAITEFYESPAGQSLLDKNPELMMNLMQALEQWMQPLLADLQQELKQIASESVAEQ